MSTRYPTTTHTSTPHVADHPGVPLPIQAEEGGALLPPAGQLTSAELDAICGRPRPVVATYDTTEAEAQAIEAIWAARRQRIREVAVEGVLAWDEVLDDLDARIHALEQEEALSSRDVGRLVELRQRRAVVIRQRALLARYWNIRGEEVGL